MMNGCILNIIPCAKIVTARMNIPQGAKSITLVNTPHSAMIVTMKTVIIRHTRIVTMKTLILLSARVATMKMIGATVVGIKVNIMTALRTMNPNIMIVIKGAVIKIPIVISKFPK